MEAVQEKALKSFQHIRTDLIKEANTGLRVFLREYFNDQTAEENLHWFRKELPDKFKEEIAYKKGAACLSRINDIRRVNKFLEKMNKNLQTGQFLLICLETKEARMVRIVNGHPHFIGLPLYFFDFVLNRVFAKTKLTRSIYFWLTKGKNRAISFTEALGRLFSCGFDVKDYVRIGYTTYILTEKVSEPVYDMEPTYGALVKLRRVGQDGKIFDVYKLRTMYAYSEYVQDFAFKNNNLENGGKIKNDFRVTGWGKIFRKLWIDELPMFFNWLKGEMKLVGIRPLSTHYFNLYPRDMQELRVKTKPGLVPPFYADLPITFDEIIESERRYLESYLEAPIRTDIRYFFRAFYNIVFKKARSA